jgi:hypothetical protein
VDIDKIHSELLGKFNNVQFLDGYNTADIQEKEYPHIHLKTQIILYVNVILTFNGYIMLRGKTLGSKCLFSLKHVALCIVHCLCNFIQTA